jgi:hypothetical protein
MAGNWDRLISIGESAIEQQIDYKKLRQRIAYAYFVKADYYAAQVNYEKALAFDPYDDDTRAYLYYCGLNLGNDEYTRYQASKLSPDAQKALKLKGFKIVDALDVELNYKTNTSNERSNSTYWRLGAESQLGYRFKLYQSVSNYRQTVNINTLTNQPDYYAFATALLSKHISLGIAYHYLYTQINSDNFPTNIVYATLSAKVNRFNFGINASVMNNGMGTFKQMGAQAGVSLYGLANVYLNSSFSQITESSGTKNIFSQSIGMQVYKNIWAEANLTLGDIKNYSDNNNLYVYNTLDANNFRAGGTVFWNINSRFTFIGNFTYDTKNIQDRNLNTNYSLYSYTGGLRWKF